MGEIRTVKDGSGNTIALVIDTAVDSTGPAYIELDSDTGRDVSLRETASGLELYNETNGAVAANWNLSPVLERSSLSLNRTQVIASANITTSGEDTVLVDSAGSTITLSDADAVDGKIIVIKDRNANAGTNANVTVDTGGSQSVEATKNTVTASGSLPTALLTTDGGAKRFQYDANDSTWHLLGAL